MSVLFLLRYLFYKGITCDLLPSRRASGSHVVAPESTVRSKRALDSVTAPANRLPPCRRALWKCCVSCCRIKVINISWRSARACLRRRCSAGSMACASAVQTDCWSRAKNHTCAVYTGLPALVSPPCWVKVGRFEHFRGISWWSRSYIWGLAGLHIHYVAGTTCAVFPFEWNATPHCFPTIKANTTRIRTEHCPLVGLSISKWMQRS